MNRIFSLIFDNDVEFIAKIPFRITRPLLLSFYTGSEMVTLDYLLTLVGAQYIVYDNIPRVY